MPVYAITGSSGYVGTRMTRRLLESPDNRVIGFDVRPPRVESDRLEFHNMDVRDRRIAAVLKGRGVHSLLHFAFVLDPFYDEKEMSDIDLGGTRNVLDAVLAAGIPHLLATSSTTAYGALPDNPVPLPETAPTRAGREFIYAHDKRLMDEMLRDFAAAHPDLKVCIVRPCIVLGPNVANYIAVNLITQPVVVMLDGADIPLQFVHEDDLVELIATLLKCHTGGVYNAVGEGTLSMREIADMQRKRTVKLPLGMIRGAVWAVQRTRLLDFSMPPGILQFFRHPWVASGEKALREVGFRPKFTSRDCFGILLERKREVVDGFKVQMKARGKR
jgi:UDP-glucose 4-epimerase